MEKKTNEEEDSDGPEKFSDEDEESLDDDSWEDIE